MNAALRPQPIAALPASVRAGEPANPRTAAARLRTIVLFAGIVPMLVALTASQVFGRAQHVQMPLHEALELAGTFIALGVAALLLLRQQYADESPHLLWVVLGLVAMGVVDCVHSQAPMGPVLSWTRHSSTLLGGLMFSLVWLEPPAALRRWRYSFAAAAALLGLAVALAIWQWPGAFPAPWVAGVYSNSVIATNAVGGLGFLAAAGYFGRRYRRDASPEDLAFFGQTLLFASAAIMFGLSDQWAADWWTWHAFRFAAYAVLLHVAYRMLVALYESVRQSADQAIRHLASIVESSDDAIIGKAKDGTILSWNKGAERLYGYAADEIVGRSIKTLARPEDHARIDAVLSRVGGGERIVHFEAQRTRKDGTEVSVSINVSPIVDTAGNVIALSTIARNITESKRAEARLRSIEWMLTPRSPDQAQPASVQPYGDLTKLNTQRTILDAVGRDLLHDIVSDYMALLGTSSAVYEKNGDYAYGIFTSGWCQAMDGASRLGCGTDDDASALSCGKWHCHESCWNEASRRSMELRAPNDIACAGGIRLYAVPITAGDEVIGSINFGYGSPPRDDATLAPLAAKYGLTVEEMRRNAAAYQARPPFIVELAKQRLLGSARLIGEIVQRKRAQAEIDRLNADLERRVLERTALLLAANKDLEGFSYSVSHDLRTPLRAVDTFSALLLQEHASQLDADGRHLLGVIRTNTARMSRLIDDVLNFSRVGKQDLALAAVPMETLAREVFEELQPAGGRPAAFEVSALPPAMADRALMRQVLQNLLDNAVKFAGGRDDPRITLRGRVENGETLYEVCDNGAGFDARYVGKLFGVFQRLHTEDEFPGSGIGLAIVKRIVAKHGGRVWAESRPGGGAIFGFSLPRREPLGVKGVSS